MIAGHNAGRAGRGTLRKRAVSAPLLLALLAALFFGGTIRAQAPAGPQDPSADAANAPPASMQALFLARKSVEKFFAQSSNVVCAESITQTIVGKNEKPSYREESKYEYQLTASNASGSLKFAESREARKLPFRDPSKTLLVTSGFASLLLILHPRYETSYQFEAAEEENVDGMRIEKYNYRDIPGAASPAALRLRGKNYPLPLSGSIWIEKESGAVTRLTAAVDPSMADLGLRGMSSDIHYAIVQFHDPEEAYWMPVSAAVDVETPLQHWRNVHRFTGYRRFKATMEIEMGKTP